MKNKITYKINAGNKARSNVIIDYFYHFLSSFNLTGAVWVLYLGYKGMSLGQIGLLEGIFHGGSFFFEIPTGVMADLMGRKRTLLLGRLMAVISSLLMLSSKNFLGFAIAFLFSAVSYNLNSGSEEALLFDSLKEINREKKFLKINGRLNFLQEVAAGIAQFSGGILAEISYFYTYVLDMVVNLAAFGNASLFFEAGGRRDIERKSCSVIKDHFKTCVFIFRWDKEVRRILLFYPVVTAFSTTTFFFGQQYFYDLGFNKVEISIIILISGLFSAFGALSADIFCRLFKRKEKYVASTALAFFIAIFGITIKPVTVIAFVLQGYFSALLYPISSNALNQLIPSERRATLLSVNSMMFSAAMIIIFPLCGFAGDRMGLEHIFNYLGIVIILFQIWFRLRSNK